MDTILWGSAGQAVVLRELLEGEGSMVVALFDNDTDARSPFAGVPLYYGLPGFEAWMRGRDSRKVQGLAAIGGARGVDRLELHALFSAHGIPIVRAIHRSAFVAADSSVGQGAQIMAHATVCAQSVIGDAALINTAANVDHECVVGRGAHVGPGAVLAGCVVVEELAFVGAGAIVLPRVRIGARSIVGAGSVVTKDVPPDVIVVGNPARLRPPVDSD
jgi:sugar O-acyltransferase (sialic acid O-acetyltransferase NeuD family)